MPNKSEKFLLLLETLQKIDVQRLEAAHKLLKAGSQGNVAEACIDLHILADKSLRKIQEINSLFLGFLSGSSRKLELQEKIFLLASLFHKEMKAIQKQRTKQGKLIEGLVKFLNRFDTPLVSILYKRKFGKLLHSLRTERAHIDIVVQLYQRDSKEVQQALKLLRVSQRKGQAVKVISAAATILPGGLTMAFVITSFFKYSKQLSAKYWELEGLLS